jgi:hypothetical protein
MLAEHHTGKSAINNRELFEEVVRHKKVFFHTSASLHRLDPFEKASGR